MDDLVRWFGQQLDADMARAQAAPPGPWTMDGAGSIVDAAGRRVIPSVGGALNGRVSRWPEGPAAEHILAQSPDHTLREIDAKRKLLALYVEHERMDRETFEAQGQHARSLVSLRAAYLDAVRHHAAVYEDRPGFRKEWRP